MERKDLHKIDDFFRRSLETLSDTPDEEVWGNISGRISETTSTGSNFSSAAWKVLSVLSAAAIVVLFVFNFQLNKRIDKLHEQVKEQNVLLKEMTANKAVDKSSKKTDNENLILSENVNIQPVDNNVKPIEIEQDGNELINTANTKNKPGAIQPAGFKTGKQTKKRNSQKGIKQKGNTIPHSFKDKNIVVNEKNNEAKYTFQNKAELQNTISPLNFNTNTTSHTNNTQKTYAQSNKKANREKEQIHYIQKNNEIESTLKKEAKGIVLNSVNPSDNTTIANTDRRIDKTGEKKVLYNKKNNEIENILQYKVKSKTMESVIKSGKNESPMVLENIERFKSQNPVVAEKTGLDKTQSLAVAEKTEPDKKQIQTITEKTEQEKKQVQHLSEKSENKEEREVVLKNDMETADRNIQKEKKKIKLPPFTFKNRFNLTANMGTGIGGHSLKASDDDISIGLDGTEKYLPGWNAELLLGMEIFPKWNIQSGMAYNEINKQTDFTHSFQISGHYIDDNNGNSGDSEAGSSEETSSDSEEDSEDGTSEQGSSEPAEEETGQTFVYDTNYKTGLENSSANGDFNFELADVEKYQPDETILTNFRLKEQTSFVEIPIIFRYDIGKNKWQINLQTGTKVHLLNKHTFSITGDNKLIKIIDWTGESKLAKQYWSLIFATGISYQLNKSLGLQFTPTYQSAITNANNKEGNWIRRPHQFDLKMGLNWRF